jgi:sulfite exporter TauE/SafE/plastocyanin domain-containing protein/copper chaperone CopZ
MLVEKKLSEITEVEQSRVNYKNGTAEIHYGQKKPDINEIEEAIRSAGYTIGYSSKKSFFSRNASDYKDLGIALLFLFGAYLVLKNFGITSVKIGGGSNPSSLAVVFLVGITAGLSTCMALVGGLILGISARHAEKHPEASVIQKFRPHLFFNAGRIISYALLGGLLGSLGSFLQLSGTTMGVVTILVGVAMLMLGLKLIGIFPRLEQGGLTLPKSISRMLGIKNHEKEYSHKGSFITGALTFFLPCGFTQAMQLYAVSTGSFLRGGLIMGIFALGTAPGLLSIGGITSAIKGIFAKRFFKFAGVVVILLSLVNISNGYTLTGWQFGSALSADKESGSESAVDPNVTLENGVQVVKMTEASSGYSPNKFTIKKDIPVRWVINATDPYSCASSIVISKLNIRKSLKAGENVIEFTPSDVGKLAFSCSMGMYTGAFDVVEGQGTSANLSSENSKAASPPSGTCGASNNGSAAPIAASCGGSGGGGGGCGCGGGSKTQINPQEGQTQASGSAQVIQASYTLNGDIQPNTFTVKAGTAVRFEVDVKEDGQGCMSTIMVPGLDNTPQLLEKGNKLTMEFTPVKTGEYKITCAMGVPRGIIKVQ